jgi:ribosomal-protein-alanine N-acetyltransferase
MSVAEQARETLPSYSVVPMSEHDLNEVVEIEESTGLSRWGWDSYYAELSRPESITLVVRSAYPDSGGRRILGFLAARLTADELHVNNIGVRESARRRGLGSELLGRALEWGKRAGAAAAILEVRGGNHAAQALYRRHGFQTVGRRRAYYHDPTEDALIMTAPLRPPA